MVCLVLLHFK